MRTGRPSRTAQQNALFRALEARRPVKERVADDRLAVHFLPPGFRVLSELAKLRPLLRLIESVIDNRWPGPRGGMIVRTRLLDDEIARALPDANQFLVLGAGYDSRAYRLEGAKSVRVFEVDHPSTQESKQKGLIRILGEIPIHVRLVPANFGSDDISMKLSKAGFQSNARTVVLWEGVTNYLTAEAVDSMFRFISSSVTSGSPIFFTYIDQSILDGSATFEGAKESSRAVKKVGEPYTFGFVPKALAGYLSDHSMKLEWDLPVREAASRFYAGAARPKVYSYYHVVKATRL